MSFFLLIIILSAAPASPICFQSKLALRFILGITVITFAHYSSDNKQNLREKEKYKKPNLFNFLYCDCSA